MEFQNFKEQASIIKVIGVGGGGSNAVNHMYSLGIKGVEFLVCNTDSQALERSPIPFKIQLGQNLTEGRGAGSLPEVGRNSAMENVEEIKKALANNTKMIFITAGMGGGTGTGAAPVIASIARELGILTVGIVTVPFAFEGKKRKQQAEKGIEELKRNVDTLLIISNDKLRLIHGDLKLTDAFGKADDILSVAAKNIAEIITVTGYINVDFADVQTVLKNSGVAIMGRAVAEGTERARMVAEQALDSPLLNDNDIKGAKNILLSITSGNNEVTMDEIGEITDLIQERAGQDADIIFGTGVDESLGDKVCITVIATGFGHDSKNSQDSRTVIEMDSVIEKEQEFIVPDTQSGFQEPGTGPVEIVMPIEIEKEELIFTTRIIEPDDQVINTESHQQEAIDMASFESQPLSANLEFSVPESNESINSNQVEDIRLETNSENGISQKATVETDPFEKAKERINRLRQISLESLNRLSSNPETIVDLEKVPAYQRRNVQLDNVATSDDNQMSRMSLYEDENKNVEIRSNNSFIHDKVD